MKNRPPAQGVFPGMATKQAPPCRCILRDIPRIQQLTGWWHDRICPAYEPPPRELMKVEFERQNWGWLLRHWTEERRPTAEDFAG